MIYNAGTLAISGNTVTGAGTNFTDATNLIRAGQTLVALTSPPQIFQIATVNTSTSLTLTAAANPAIAAGTRYAILTTDALSVDGLAQSIAQLISDYDANSAAWEAFAGTSANQNVTVTINGVAVSIPAIGKLATRGATGAVPVEQGGTGATTQAAARTGLGLGSVATKNAGKSDGNVPVVGDMFGFGHGTAGHIVLNSVSNNDIYSALSSYGSCVFRNNNPISATPHTAYGSSLWLQTGDTAGAIQIPYSPQGRITVISAQANVGVWSRMMYDTNNTTVDSNGNLRPASPIVKVSGDGTAELNYESEGVSVERISTGVYKISGVFGFNSDPVWGGTNGGYVIPQNANGLPLLWVDYEIAEDGDITLRTYHREHANVPAFARNHIDGLADGDPVDIPIGRWVDLRVEMPENSLWNVEQARRAEEMALALEMDREEGAQSQ